MKPSTREDRHNIPKEDIGEVVIEGSVPAISIENSVPMDSWQETYQERSQKYMRLMKAEVELMNDLTILMNPCPQDMYTRADQRFHNNITLIHRLGDMNMVRSYVDMYIEVLRNNQQIEFYKKKEGQDADKHDKE